MHAYIHTSVQVCHFKDKSQPEESKKLIKFVSGLAQETIVDVFGVLTAADVKVRAEHLLYTPFLLFGLHTYIHTYIHTYLHLFLVACLSE